MSHENFISYHVMYKINIEDDSPFFIKVSIAPHGKSDSKRNALKWDCSMCASAEVRYILSIYVCITQTEVVMPASNGSIELVALGGKTFTIKFRSMGILENVQWTEQVSMATIFYNLQQAPHSNPEYGTNKNETNYHPIHAFRLEWQWKPR